jgi:uncharacterized protein (TIGR02118 family)
MIKVSIFYPNTPGSRFDMDYYCSKHMPMVKERMAGACSHFTVDQGLAGGRPDQPAAYAAIGQLFFDSLESFQKAFGPHAREIHRCHAGHPDQPGLGALNHVHGENLHDRGAVPNTKNSNCACARK